MSKQDAVKVKKDHQESPMIIGDREISLNYSFPPRDRGGPALPRRAVKDRHPPSATIFIGNVPYEATREDIREGVKHLGDVTAVRIGALLCGTVQLNCLLSPGLYSAHQGREPEGVRTCRL